MSAARALMGKEQTMALCGKDSPMPKIAAALVRHLLSAVILLFSLLPALARDNGQWESIDPAISVWFRTLMQPDAPDLPCCGEADAYWADGVEVKDGQVIAIITDTRPDKPLGRHHVPVGTRIVVPPNKVKWDRGNPTGHTVIFLSSTQFVICFVPGIGT
jgi:hypothetical protein